MSPRPLTREDFEAVRIGKKDYAFRRKSNDGWISAPLVKRYPCSHLEAERRFKLWLVKQRMLA